MAIEHFPYTLRCSYVECIYIYETDFKIKTVTRDKEGHDTTIKGSIQDEDITVGDAAFCCCCC